MSEYIVLILKDWKEKAGVNEPILFELSLSRNQLIIFSSKPGYLIGEGGKYVSEYLEIIKKELFFNPEFEILFKETCGYVL